ncbi:hypothetical protein HOLleu_31449 [Holothuria leucospilota]|uniref:RNA-directed DNA polymerase n=1 Tax=Holothuria leucospilota TaxID=206669 RepID=A0A9Q0YQ47_HOLLE|nr:hypothetical protein HOLleu_31449 [Holothuria leucospilota]
MVFNTPPGYKHGFNIVINNVNLQNASSVKFLGVFVDSKLTWNDHISHLCSQVEKGVGIIGRLKHILPKNVIRSIYLTLVYPHLSYCSLSWSGTSKTSLNKLTVLQKRAIRQISSLAPRDHTSTLFKYLNLLKLQEIIKVNIATFTYRYVNNFLPPGFSHFFQSKLFSSKLQYASETSSSPSREPEKIIF